VAYAKDEDMKRVNIAAVAEKRTHRVMIAIDVLMKI
jgi:hypothetical protein